MATKEQELLLDSSGRLDRVLASALKESRNQISNLIALGAVKVDNKIITKPSFKVKEGQRVTYSFLKAPSNQIKEVDFNIEILYEDDAILVINKPSGIVVHPAPSVKEPTVVDWLINRGVSLSTIAGKERFGIVHRLDKETTGAMVIAKTNSAHRVLADELATREMGRYYLAVIDCPLKESCSIEAPIGRNPKNRLKMAIVPNGRVAKTDFLKLSELRDGSELISARLHSGRTHQIRVHLAHIGRHILGDETYGYRKKIKGVNRVFLHAGLLYLSHPITKKQIEVVAPLFSDMREYLEKNLNRSQIDELSSLKNSVLHFNSIFGDIKRV